MDPALTSRQYLTLGSPRSMAAMTPTRSTWPTLPDPRTGSLDASLHPRPHEYHEYEEHPTRSPSGAPQLAVSRGVCARISADEPFLGPPSQRGVSCVPSRDELQHQLGWRGYGVVLKILHGRATAAAGMIAPVSCEIVDLQACVLSYLMMAKAWCQVFSSLPATEGSRTRTCPSKERARSQVLEGCQSARRGFR